MEINPTQAAGQKEKRKLAPQFEERKQHHRFAKETLKIAAENMTLNSSHPVTELDPEDLSTDSAMERTILSKDRQDNPVFDDVVLLDSHPENSDQQIHQTKEHRDNNNRISSRESVDSSDPFVVLTIHSHLKLVVDLQTNIKAQQSAAYARKVKLSNLKEMARTVSYVQEHGFSTREELRETHNAAAEQYQAAQKILQAMNTQLMAVNEQIHFAGQYYANKSVQTEFLRSGNKGRYRAAHREELARYNEAVKYFREHHDGTISSLKSLKARRDQLVRQRDSQRITVQDLRERQKELRTVCANVDMILRTDPAKRETEQVRSPGRKKTQNREPDLS